LLRGKWLTLKRVQVPLYTWQLKGRSHKDIHKKCRPILFYNLQSFSKLSLRSAGHSQKGPCYNCVLLYLTTVSQLHALHGVQNEKQCKWWIYGTYLEGRRRTKTISGEQPASWQNIQRRVSNGRFGASLCGTTVLIILICTPLFGSITRDIWLSEPLYWKGGGGVFRFANKNKYKNISTIFAFLVMNFQWSAKNKSCNPTPEHPFEVLNYNLSLSSAKNVCIKREFSAKQTHLHFPECW
jgi:hypothetical protein